MTALEEREIESWREAAADLGFRFVAPYTLQHAGDTFTYLGWLPQFGSDYGMLVIVAENLHEQHRLIEAARAHGFAYSCISHGDDPYDREVMIDVLNDWGWASSESPPSWYTPLDDDNE